MLPTRKEIKERSNKILNIDWKFITDDSSKYHEFGHIFDIEYAFGREVEVWLTLSYLDQNVLATSIQMVGMEFYPGPSNRTSDPILKHYCKGPKSLEKCLEKVIPSFEKYCFDLMEKLSMTMAQFQTKYTLSPETKKS